MAFDYINEAFKKLDLLEEQLFDTSLNGINQLSNFLDSDDTTEEVVRVIDDDAQEETDIKPSYVGKVIINCNVCHSHVFEDKENILLDENGTVNVDKQCPYCGEQEGFTIIGEIAPFVSPDSEDIETDTSEEDNIDSEELADTDANTSANDESDDSLESEPEAVQEISEETMSRATKRLVTTDVEEQLTEDFKEVSITTEDQHMEMTSDDNGKVTITTEPLIETSEESDVSNEMIVPVSDETEEEILNNNDVKTSAEEVEDTQEDISSDEVNFDFDEVDEDSLDELGESYFRSVYENVNSFKTSCVSANDQALIVEGVITFNSGAEKRTGFIFEAQDANAKGQLRFSGFNKQLCESKDAFSLVGKIENNKLFAESLRYNYKVNENFVRGIVRRK